jgi:hypothetical protein
MPTSAMSWLEKGSKDMAEDGVPLLAAANPVFVRASRPAKTE